MCEDALVAAAKQGQGGSPSPHCANLTARRLIRNAQGITRNHEDAEDALQDAFLSASFTLRILTAGPAFSTWADAHRDQFSAYDPFAKNVVARNIHASASRTQRDIGWEYWTLPRIRRGVRPARDKERLLREAIRDLRQTIRRVVEIQQLSRVSMKKQPGLWASQ